MKKTLPLFSYVFHPIFIPVFAVLSYFLLNENVFSFRQKYLLLLQVAIILVFIPVCIFFLLRMFGKIDSVMLAELSQRKIPLLIQAVLIYTLISKSITIDRVFELYFFFFGALVSSVAALGLALLNVKASLHMLGISALTAFVIGLSLHNHVNALFLIAFLVMLNGVIASSRLQMKAHTNTELAIGFCCGIVPQLALLVFWL